MKKLDDAIISYVKELAKAHKFDNLTSTIIGILFAEPEELTMDELAKRTGYSLASVCNKLKFLEQLNIITRKTKPGTKTIFITMEKDMVKMMRQAISEMQIVNIGITKKTLPRIIEQFKNKVKSNKERGQIRMLEKIYEDALRFERIIQELIKRLNEIK